MCARYLLSLRGAGQPLGALAVRWVILSLLSAACSADFTALKETAPGCKGTSEYLECNVVNYTEGVKFDNDDWTRKSTRKIAVTGAKALHLISQQGVSGITWNFVNCSGVRVDDPNSSPLTKLSVTHSEVTDISRIDGVLKGTESVFKRVNIDNLEQFDFVQSQISELNIRATKTKSTINGSRVEVMNLQVKGPFLFEIIESTIKEIKKLIYDTTDTNSRIVETEIGTIGRESFVVSGSKLLLENVTITTLASRAFLVRSALVLQNCQIQNAVFDSFVLEDGSIDLQNVMIGDKTVSFAIDKASGGLFVLALIFPQSSNVTGLAVGISLSLIFGILCGAGLAYLILRWRKQGQDRSQDNMELLPSKKESIPTLPSNPPPPTPTPQHQSLQEEKDLGDDEIYEEYDEVTNQAPAPPRSVNLLPGSNFLRPSDNLSPPAGVHSNGGPPATGLAPPEPPRRDNKPAPQPPSRDGPPLPTNLPPLPPAASPAPRPPPISENKPQLPKPISRPEETSSAGDNDLEVYDEVSEQVPTPPPTAQRPPIPAGKPSFLHKSNAAQPSPRSPPGTDPEKPRFGLPGMPKGRVDPPGPRAPAGSAGPAAPGAQPWGKPRAPHWPPGTPSRPPPPPSELKPSSGSITADDDDEDIYETVPE
ncbi:proline-rich protein 12-like isoform X1 [Penaeus monodon]|uniref:proline-rich protein 12-like isoform X1 n=1 Tax=Penaeus monodon TaxID=6687 RepID=UPI0018A7D3C6|nr:proline-rich protein 12-like isoform X1 [Penaeus monodon]